MSDFDFSILNTSFNLIFSCSLPFVLAALGGGLIAGIIKAATQIDDRVFSFVGRVSGVLIFAYLMMGERFSNIFDFTKNVWMSQNYYF